MLSWQEFWLHLKLVKRKVEGILDIIGLKCYLVRKEGAVSFIVKFLRNFVISAIFLGKRKHCRLPLAYNSERLCILVNVLQSLEVLGSGRTYVTIAYNLGILLVFTERA